MEELLLAVRERCDEHDVSPVFWVSARYLPCLVSGSQAHPFPAGEEAIVDLPSFDPRRQSPATCARATKGKREGLRFEVVVPGDFTPLLPELKGGSPTAGCTASRAGRRAFSVGSFDPAYLTLSPMALVARRGGADRPRFANLWTSDNKASPSI